MEELQVEGLRDSISFIREIIRTEARAVDPRHIVLLGLSQGSATGTSLRSPSSKLLRDLDYDYLVLEGKADIAQVYSLSLRANCG